MAVAPDGWHAAVKLLLMGLELLTYRDMYLPFLQMEEITWKYGPYVAKYGQATLGGRTFPVLAVSHPSGAAKLGRERGLEERVKHHLQQFLDED